MSFASLRADLNLDISGFTKSLVNASSKMQGFAKNLTGGYDKANESLKRHTLGLKDTARIVQGIIISQTFYRAVGAIQSATSALMSFNEQLDYTHVTFSALFGSSQLASDFSKVLQESAVNSIFDYESLLGSSKKLLAYGIQYENLMYIMEGLMDLGSMSGDTAALDRIALALGQIQAKGKLGAEEMKQLANAYVPIQDIVQEKFNLTPDQMGKIGDLNLPAHEVINAIIDYANENFGKVSDAAMLTITGLKNRIIDTMKVLSVEMTQPLMIAWKSFLKFAADGLQSIRDSFKLGGWGGLFEQLVPNPDTQTTIKAFLANLHNGFVAVGSLISGIARIVGQIGQAFILAFNVVGPVVINVIHALGSLLHVLANTKDVMATLRVATVLAAAAFVILKTKALASMVIVAVGKAIQFVSAQLVILSSLITKHPMIMLVAGLAVALVAVAAASNNADNSLSKLFKTLSGAGGGITQDDVLKKTSGELDDINEKSKQFNNEMKANAESANQLGNEIAGAGKKAGKAAKEAAGLLSFDEVFKLNEPSEDNGSGAGTGIADALSGLTEGFSGLGEALIPDIPDFTDFANEFTNQMFGDLYAAVARAANGAVTGALLGALAGFAIGGLVTGSLAGALGGAKLGAKIGAGLGAVFATFWGDAYKEVEAILQSMAVGSMTGALLGGLAGFIIGGMITKTIAGAITGAQWGMGIGAAAGAVVGGIFDDFSKVLEERIGAIAAGGAEGMLVGGIAGLLIGAFATRNIKGALAGARIGAGLGAVAGAAIGGILSEGEASLTESINNMFKDIQAVSYGVLIGALAGMLVGAIVGAFAGGVGALPGAKAGAAIGAAVGGLGTMLVQYLENTGITAKVTEWFTGLGKSIAEGVGKGIEKIKESDFWQAITKVFDTIVGFFKKIFGIHSPATKMNPIGSNIILGVLEGFKTAFVDVLNWITGTATEIKDALSTWWTETKAGWSNWWTETKTGWSTWATETKEKISTWWTGTKNTFSTSLEETKTKWSTKWGEIKGAFSTWTTEINEKISTWWIGTKNKFSSSLEETKTKWSTKWGEIKTAGAVKWNEIKTAMATWLDEGLKKNGSSLEEVKTVWSNKWIDVKTKAGTTWNAIKTDASTFLGALLTNNDTKLNELKTKWSTKWGEIKTNLSTWWDGMLISMKTWLEEKIWQPIADFFNLDNFWTRISGLLTAIKTKISNWWSDIKGTFSSGVTINTNVGLAGGGAPLNDGVFKNGHATGGIFNREHIARFAEGNKAEAVIPLENASAMQPFVNAISQGIIESLAPVIANGSGGSNSGLPPMYVGTLVADERGLKQLYKKFEVFEMQENARRGVTV